LDTSGGVGHLTWAIDSGSLPPGLTLSSTTGTISGQPTAVGTYSFVVRTTDQFGPPATTALTLSVNIQSAHLTITASSPTITYGSTTPPITPSYTGLANGDSAPATLPTCTVSPTLRNGKPIVGTYTTSCSGASDPNYTISYVDGTLTVNKALLTITADNQSRVFGAPNPTLTTTPSGFVNGDDARVLSGAPALSTVGITTPVGTYPITVALGSVSAHDYNFHFVNGTLTITADATTTAVIANPDPSTFGTPVTITATVAPVSPGTITPNGTVEFSRGGNVLGPPVPLVGGKASLPITSLISGQTITATYTPANANFTGSSGTVSPTVACAVNHTVTGSVSGNLDLVGPGGWCVSGATVNGSINIGKGVSALIMNSHVGGTIAGKTAAAIAICGTTTGGAVNISYARGFVLIGDPGDDGCAPNTIGGSVNLMRNRGGVEMAQNTVFGSLTARSNRGTGPFLEDTAPEFENNAVSGPVNIR